MSDHVTALARDEQQCIGCGASQRPAPCVPGVSLTVHVGAHGRHALVTASGEIDLDSSPALDRILQDALDQSTDGVEVDLAHIVFCDCSGINALLHVRRRARETAKTLTVRVPSPAVQRLLELTGTLDVLTTTDTAQTPSTGDDRSLPELGPEHDPDPSRPMTPSRQKSTNCAAPCRPARPSTSPAASSWPPTPSAPNRHGTSW